jgi:hypothetical protein
MRVAPPTLRHAADPRGIARFALALCLLSVVPPASRAAQDLKPLPQLSAGGVLDRSSEGLVRASWISPAQPVYPGGRVALDLAITIDESFLADHMVQPFTRRLDVPVALDELQLPGLDHEAFGPSDPRAESARIAFGDHVLFATRTTAPTPGERVLVLRTLVQAQRSGTFELPAPVVRFASADEFRDELLGRVPVGARLAFSKGSAAQLVVAPFPEAGRHPDFNGAIGPFTVSAHADAQVLRVGDVLRVTLEIEGALPADDAALPRLDQWRGLHLRSTRVTRREGGATLEAELRVERATVREIPAVELHSFDPQEARYLVARSAAIPLRVTTGVELAPAEEVYGRAPRWAFWPLLGAGLGLAYLLRRRSRRRRAARS